MKENSCSCDTCKNMCKTTPCLPTPEDVASLVIAGYKDRLTKSYWAVGLVQGTNENIIEIVAPIYDNERKCCTFLDDNDLCILHDLGLKPTEGKLASCKPEVITSFKDTINYKVAMTWESK